MNTCNMLTGVPQVNFKRPLNGDNHVNMLSTLLIQKFSISSLLIQKEKT